MFEEVKKIENIFKEEEEEEVLRSKPKVGDT